MDQQLERAASPSSIATGAAELAYHHTREEMSALPDERLLIVNLDIPMTVGRVLAGLPQLREVEARVAVCWHDPPTGQVERLERYAGALQHAHLLCQKLKVAQPEGSELARELALVRQRLLATGRALVVTGVLAADLLEPYRKIKSHRSLVGSVRGLVTLYQAQWARIRDKTPMSAEALSAALALATALSEALQQRGRVPDGSVHALRERQQAFTLLIREHTGLRRAAHFLYGTRDADRRVPSLYVKRRRAQQSRVSLPGAIGA